MIFLVICSVEYRYIQLTSVNFKGTVQRDFPPLIFHHLNLYLGRGRLTQQGIRRRKVIFWQIFVLPKLKNKIRITRRVLNQNRTYYNHWSGAEMGQKKNLRSKNLVGLSDILWMSSELLCIVQMELKKQEQTINEEKNQRMRLETSLQGKIKVADQGSNPLTVKNNLRSLYINTLTIGKPSP